MILRAGLGSAITLVTLSAAVASAQSDLPRPADRHKDLATHLGACHNSFGQTAFALCRRSGGSTVPLHRGERLHMRLTGGARQANGRSEYTTNYGMVQALLPGGRPFAPGEGVVVTGVIRRKTDIAVAFGPRRFSGYAVWHLRKAGHRLTVNIGHGVNGARLELDGHRLLPFFSISPGKRLENSALGQRFVVDRAGFLGVLGGGGEICRYLLDSLARRMTRAQCARLRRELAADKNRYLPIGMLKKSFWDYNGAIVAVTQARRPSSTAGKYSRESWQLEGGRFRFLAAQ